MTNKVSGLIIQVRNRPIVNVSNIIIDTLRTAPAPADEQVWSLPDTPTTHTTPAPHEHALLLFLTCSDLTTRSWNREQFKMYEM